MADSPQTTVLAASSTAKAESDATLIALGAELAACDALKSNCPAKDDEQYEALYLQHWDSTRRRLTRNPFLRATSNIRKRFQERSRAGRVHLAPSPGLVSRKAKTCLIGWRPCRAPGQARDSFRRAIGPGMETTPIRDQPRGEAGLDNARLATSLCLMSPPPQFAS
jgi:hypothetical protein